MFSVFPKSDGGASFPTPEGGGRGVPVPVDHGRGDPPGPVDRWRAKSVLLFLW